MIQNEIFQNNTLNFEIYKGLVILNKNHLKSRSKLHTDENGFIHIRAANFEDAFFTMGYFHAHDRLWQIDFFRRFARGKLSAILGSQALNAQYGKHNLNKQVDKFER